jgi:hydrogenase-1 operon protein HyaF
MDCNSPNTKKTSDIDDVLSFVSTGNAAPLLHEIKHALGQLLENNVTSTIDLGAIPFAPGDERLLNDVLGVGEVHAALAVMGESHVRETAVPGVWRIDHFDEDGEIQSRFIEITFMPDILKTQRTDAETGLETLSQRLNALDDNR